MKRIRIISGEAPPEQLMRRYDAVLIGMAAQQGWNEPEVVQARQEHPAVAAYLFRDQRDCYLFTIQDSLQDARDYAARYELSLRCVYNGVFWKTVE